MTQNKNEEEVDLGSLFLIIGKGISNFFNFILGFFKGIFYFLIEILLFLKRNFIKLGVALLVGGIAGLLLEVKKDTEYGSNLLVKTNFDSARQLYNNISYYNDLVKQENYPVLAEIFEMDQSKAEALTSFKIEPVKNSNDILTTYYDLLVSIDTTVVKSYDFSDFKKQFTKYNYKIHDIEVQATRNDIFSNMDKVIISAITDNSYFNRLKELTNENLNRTNNLLRKSLSQTDSLHNIYKKVLLEEAKSQKQGTNIDLGSRSDKIDKELALFVTKLKLSDELRDISKEISEKSQVINVISNFQPIGYKVKGISENRAFQLAIASFILMVLFLLLAKLNLYLDNYNRKK